jgi:hypothetical protein
MQNHPNEESSGKEYSASGKKYWSEEFSGVDQKLIIKM